MASPAPRRSLPSQLLSPLLLAVLAACAGPEGDGPQAVVEAPGSKIAPELLAQLGSGAAVEVIVTLDEAQIAASAPEGNALSLAAGDLGAELRAARFGSVKQGLLQALSAAASEAPELRHDYSHLPALHLGVTSQSQLEALAARPEVLALHPNGLYQHALAESLPLIHQPQAAAAGADGAGTTVAVLDTGVDYQRAAFGSCTAPGVPAGCRVVYAADFALSDNALDDNGHGTNVAGIVLGVAPKSQIAALDVFAGQGAYAADIIAAINWVVSNRAKYNIVAMNLSLGGGSSATACGSDVFAASIAAARAAGVAPVIASGNNGYTNQLSSPACVPAAISVGAVYDAAMSGLSFSTCKDVPIAADQITCFSNSASFLTLLAPGALITAAGYTMAGTSQATPHVAGAFAALRSKFPKESVDQVLARLTSTGARIKDARNGVTTPRIDVAAAAGAASGGAVDTTPPTGSVTINGGAAVVGSPSVTLSLTATDPSGVSSMCVSNKSPCTAWVAYAKTLPWTLGGAGKQSVLVWFKDGAGNATPAAAPVTASALVDPTPPVDGKVVGVAGVGQVALSWSGFSDPSSGVASYKVVAAPASPPATCASGTQVYAGSGFSAVASGLTNGTSYGFRVCALDLAGNTSAGAVATAKPVGELSPPTNVLVLVNARAAATKTAAVTLTLSASDPSGVASVCVSNTASCSAWLPFKASLPWTLTAGDGAKTVYAWFADTWGNATGAPTTATIKLDATAPAGGSVSATGVTAAINLAWSGFSDAGSGVASYKVVATSGATAPAAGCATGTMVYAGTATSAAHKGLAAGAKLAYRVCAVDGAGNVSAGAAATGTAK